MKRNPRTDSPRRSLAKAGLSPGYGPLLADIKARVRAAQIRAHLAANGELLALYWDIGRLILERQKAEGWGTKVIHRLSRDLQNEFPGQQGFSPRNLKYMRAFAEAWPETVIVQPPVAQLTLTASKPIQSKVVLAPLAQTARTVAAIVHQPGAQLPWKHHCLILDKLDTAGDRLWYAAKAVEHGWSRDVLALQIDSGLHTRQGKAVTNFKTTLRARRNPIGGTHQDQSQRDCVPKPRVARHEPARSVLVIICSSFPWDCRPDAINPNGVATTSRPTRVRDWEGARRLRRFSVRTVGTFRFCHDCGHRSGMNAALLRVLGRALTRKPGQPHQTAQPRWGWLLFVPFSQGSSCLATLGFTAESLWDSSGSNCSHSLTQRLP